MPDSPTGDTPAVGDTALTPSGNSDGNISDVKSSAQPSTGDEGAAEGSIVDAVSSALKPKPTGEGSPASQTPDSTHADPAKAEQSAEELPEEVTEEELRDQKPKTRKRIEQLLGKVKGLSTERDELAPKAQEFDRLVNFIGSSNLTKEDVDTTFELAALVRNDPVKAYDRLVPIMQQLQQIVGETLPAELQERVRLGYISEQDARELHRSRSREHMANRKTQETETRAAEQREQDRRQGVVRDVSSAVSSWETAKKTSDPDWHMKAARVDQLVRLQVYEKGYPQTKEAALQMMDSIYDEVTKEVRKFIPRPEAKQGSPAGSSSTTVAEPKSILDAVRIGLNK